MAGMSVLLTGNLDRAGGVLFTSPAIDAVGTGRARHQLLMHPEDLEERGIADGATVEVTSRVGTVEVEVLPTDDVMRGVASLPHGYGHRREGVLRTQAVDLPGVSINDLTDPELLDVSGDAALDRELGRLNSSGSAPEGLSPTAACGPRRGPRRGRSRRARPRPRPRRGPWARSRAGHPRVGPRRRPSTAT